MSSAAEMAERQGRMLAELAELGLTLARELQARALSADTPAEAAQLAEAFHRIGRSVRQSLALEAKLNRDAQREAREQHELEARETEARRAARKTQLRKGVERLIWDEVEEPEVADAMLRDAPHFVEREAESEAFLDEPVEAQIARIREVLGVDEAWNLEADDAEAGPPDDAPHDSHAAADDAPPAGPAPSSKPPGSSPYDYWYNST
jgi:hypothetical protein